MSATPSSFDHKAVPNAKRSRNGNSRQAAARERIREGAPSRARPSRTVSSSCALCSVDARARPPVGLTSGSSGRSIARIALRLRMTSVRTTSSLSESLTSAALRPEACVPNDGSCSRIRPGPRPARASAHAVAAPAKPAPTRTQRVCCIATCPSSIRRLPPRAQWCRIRQSRAISVDDRPRTIYLSALSFSPQSQDAASTSSGPCAADRSSSTATVACTRATST